MEPKNTVSRKDHNPRHDKKRWELVEKKEAAKNAAMAEAKKRAEENQAKMTLPEPKPEPKPKTLLEQATDGK